MSQQQQQQGLPKAEAQADRGGEEGSHFGLVKILGLFEEQQETQYTRII